MDLRNLDHLRTHGEEALKICLPLPLVGECRGEGSPRTFQLPLPPHPNRYAMRGFLPGLLRPFALKGHGQ